MGALCLTSPTGAPPEAKAERCGAWRNSGKGALPSGQLLEQHEPSTPPTVGYMDAVFRQNRPRAIAKTPAADSTTKPSCSKTGTSSPRDRKIEDVLQAPAYGSQVTNLLLQSDIVILIPPFTRHNANHYNPAKKAELAKGMKVSAVLDQYGACGKSSDARSVWAYVA